MTLPRCLLLAHLQPQGSALGGPGASPRPALARPGPGALLLPSLCPTSRSTGPPSLLWASSACVSPAWHSVFPLELSLSPASGLSLSLSTSPVGLSLSLRVSASLACPSLLRALSLPSALSRAFPGPPAPQPSPEPPGAGRCPAGVSPAPAPGPVPPLAPRDPGAHSPGRQKGSCSFLGWEGMRAGLGTAPELPAAMGEVPLV